MAGRDFDIYTQIEQLQNELFAQTATDIDFIRRIGLLKGIDVNPASSAVGFATATGTISSIISDGTLYQTEDGNEYEVINGNYVISNVLLSVNSLTRSGSTATASFVTTHSFCSRHANYYCWSCTN